MGCLLSRDLQTLDKSDPVPRTGGQTVPGRLSDDGSPAGSCRVMESFFSLPPHHLPCGQKIQIPSGHTSAAVKGLLASRTLLPSPFLCCPGAASVSSSVVGPGLWFRQVLTFSWGSCSHLYSWRPSEWQCLPWLHGAIPE